MAIPSTNVMFGDKTNPTTIAYELWGSVYDPATNKTFTQALGTDNITGSNLALGSLKLVASSLSRNPAALLWGAGVYGDKSSTITAVAAWKVSYAGSANFSIYSISGSVTLTGSGVTATIGGSGTVTVRRAAVAGAYSGTVTITYTAGGGGSQTTTIDVLSSG